MRERVAFAYIHPLLRQTLCNNKLILQHNIRLICMCARGGVHNLGTLEAHYGATTDTAPEMRSLTLHLAALELHTRVANSPLNVWRLLEHRPAMKRESYILRRVILLCKKIMVLCAQCLQIEFYCHINFKYLLALKSYKSCFNREN